MPIAAAIERVLTATRSTHPLKPGRCWLVIGPNTWGKAFNLCAAYENAERPRTFHIYDAPPCVYVDDMGGICWFPNLYRSADEVTEHGAYPKAHSIGFEATLVETHP